MNKELSFPSSQQGFQATCVVRWRKRCPVALFKFFCGAKTSKKTCDGLVLSTTVANEAENLMTNIWFGLNQSAKIPQVT